MAVALVVSAPLQDIAGWCRHEGEVLEVYEDSLGYLTLGVGHLIQKSDPEYGQPAGTPVSQEVVDMYYDNDFDKHIEETIKIRLINNILNKAIFFM